MRVDRNQIKRMVQGKAKELFTKKVQVGYTPDTPHREVGEKWIDADGVPWEQKKGYTVKGRLATSETTHPSWDRKCQDCDTLCTKRRDVDTYKRMERCFACQVRFEEDLKFAGKWEAWVVEQEQKRWAALDQHIEDVEEHLSTEGEIFDKSVANALANANVSETEKKLKNL